MPGPTALTMHRWAQRVDSDVQRSDLESSTSHYADIHPIIPGTIFLDEG